MNLLDAVNSSTVGAAYRPWELTPETVDPYDLKYIVINKVNEDLYVVWAEDFTFARELFPQEYYKIEDKVDWEPVSPKAPAINV